MVQKVKQTGSNDNREKMPVKQFTDWTVFGEIQTATTTLIACNALPLSLTSTGKSPQTPHRPVRIHHNPHIHPMPIPMGIRILTAALSI